MAFEISAAVAGDIPRLVELLKDLFGIEFDFTYDASCQDRGLELLITESEKGNRVKVVVARDEQGHAIGMVSGQLVISTAEGAASVWVEDLVVHPEYRRNGIGSAMLDHLLSWGKAQGATRAQLVNDKDNPHAEVFYNSRGWQTTQLGVRRFFIE